MEKGKGRDGGFSAEQDAANTSRLLGTVGMQVLRTAVHHDEWMRLWNCSLCIRQLDTTGTHKFDTKLEMQRNAERWSLEYEKVTRENGMVHTGNLTMDISPKGGVYYGQHQSSVRSHRLLLPPSIPSHTFDPMEGASILRWGLSVARTRNVNHLVVAGHPELQVYPRLRQDIEEILSLLQLTSRMRPVRATFLKGKPIEGLDPQTWYTYEEIGKSLQLGLSPEESDDDEW